MSAETDYDGFITPDGEMIAIQDVDKMFLQVTKITQSREIAVKELKGLGDYCLEKGYHEATCRYYEKIVELTEDVDEKAGMYLHVGAQMEKVCRFDLAVESYSKAIMLHPRNVQINYYAHNNLGYSLNQLGKHADAEHYCREAIHINSNYCNAHKNLGEALKGLGRYVEAAESFIIATVNNNSDLRAFNLLIDMLDEQPEVLHQMEWLEEEIINSLGERIKERRETKGSH